MGMTKAVPPEKWGTMFVGRDYSSEHSLRSSPPQAPVAVPYQHPSYFLLPISCSLSTTLVDSCNNYLPSTKAVLARMRARQVIILNFGGQCEFLAPRLLDVWVTCRLDAFFDRSKGGYCFIRPLENTSWRVDDILIACYAGRRNERVK